MSKKGLLENELCRLLEESDISDCNISDYDSDADPVYRADDSDEFYSSSDDETGPSNSIDKVLMGKLFRLQ